MPSDLTAPWDWSRFRADVEAEMGNCGYSARGLAADFGLSAGAFCDWLRGRTIGMTVDSVARVADALDLHLDDYRTAQ